MRPFRYPVGNSVLVLLLMCMASGCGKTLAFGTATKFGVDISQRPDQVIEVTMGYDRYELVSVAAQDKDATEDQDTYSVLGIFAVRYGNPWTLEPLVLRQFFATGRAAQQAADHPAFQRYFGRKTGEIIREAEREIKRQDQEGGR